MSSYPTIIENPYNACHLIDFSGCEIDEFVQYLEDEDFFVTVWHEDEIKEELQAMDETAVAKFEALSPADKAHVAMLIVSYLEGDIVINPTSVEDFGSDFDTILEKAIEHQESGPRHPTVLGWRVPVLATIDGAADVYVAEERCPTTLKLLRQDVSNFIPVLAPSFEDPLVDKPVDIYL